jgi:hypothetical protein
MTLNAQKLIMRRVAFSHAAFVCAKLKVMPTYNDWPILHNAVGIMVEHPQDTNLETFHYTDTFRQ